VWPGIEQISFNPVFLDRVEELGLSVRSANCVKNDKINYLGDLVQKSEAEMLRSSNFGHKSLHEIKDALGQMDLNLGMEVPGWPASEVLLSGESRWSFVVAEIESICRSLADPWESSVLALNGGRDINPIIADTEEKVSLYLENLKML